MNLLERITSTEIDSKWQFVKLFDDYFYWDFGGLSFAITQEPHMQLSYLEVRKIYSTNDKINLAARFYTFLGKQQEIELNFLYILEIFMSIREILSYYLYLDEQLIMDFLWFDNKEVYCIRVKDLDKLILFDLHICLINKGKEPSYVIFIQSNENKIPIGCIPVSYRTEETIISQITSLNVYLKGLFLEYSYKKRKRNEKTSKHTNNF